MAILSVYEEDYTRADSLFRLSGNLQQDILRKSTRHISEQELAAFTENNPVVLFLDQPKSSEPGHVVTPFAL